MKTLIVLGAGGGKTGGSKNAKSSGAIKSATPRQLSKYGRALTGSARTKFVRRVRGMATAGSITSKKASAILAGLGG